jgi:polyribonucleotide nucleotidyltransferase
MEELQQQQYALPYISTGLSKTQIKVLADSAVSGVLEDGNVLQVAEALSAMDEFVKTVRKDDRFIDSVIEELGKSKGRITTASGAKIETTEAGVSYDYSQNADWKELDSQIKELTEKRKAIEEVLKKIQPGKMLVDEETGETLVGPAKTSTSSYKLTLAK